MVGSETSIALSVCAPAVMNFTWTVASPFTTVTSAGRTAAGSLLLKWIVCGEAVGSLFPDESSTSTVTGRNFPIEPEPPVRSRVLASPASMATALEVPVIVRETVSVAVIVWRPAARTVAVNVWTPASAAVNV